VILLSLVSYASSHSWVTCTDYNIQASGDARDYNPALCRGYGRGWAASSCERTNNQFGLDCGYNYQPGSGAVCKTSLSPTNYGASYTTASPMATYSPGQKVCLAWPPKNHVAASCANRYIPDHGTKLYMSGPNPTADPASLARLSTTTLIKDFGTNTVADGYVGFQNCPKFCQDNDKSLCTGCFNLPTNLQAGATYSFFWAWGFNSDSDVYTSCWEAKISGSSANPQSSIEQTSAQKPVSSQTRTSQSTIVQQATSEADPKEDTSAQTSASQESRSAQPETKEPTQPSGSQVQPVDSGAINLSVTIISTSFFLWVLLI